MKIENHKNREAYFSASDASWVMWSSFMIAKTLNCALG